MTTQCRKCGTTNPDAANFCGRCGVSVSPRGARSMTPDFPLLRQWRRLKFRMTRKEVRAILGEPAKIETIGVTEGHAVHYSVHAPMERWFFEYVLSYEQPIPATLVRGSQCSNPTSVRQLRGIVEFAPPDGTVSSWAEPDWTFVAFVE